VIQEWWGLDSGIKEMADRLAAAGFVALAPDLYHGELAAHDEMDKAGQLMQSLPPDRAGRDMSAAVDYLAGLDGATGSGIRCGRLLHGWDAGVDHRRDAP
jgi:carboxymethylenebutenolidase